MGQNKPSHNINREGGGGIGSHSPIKLITEKEFRKFVKTLSPQAILTMDYQVFLSPENKTLYWINNKRNLHLVILNPNCPAFHVPEK